MNPVPPAEPPRLIQSSSSDTAINLETLLQVQELGLFFTPAFEMRTLPSDTDKKCTCTASLGQALGTIGHSFGWRQSE